MTDGKCPVTSPGRSKDLEDWWPNRLDLRILKQNQYESIPLDKNFNYAKEFSKLDLRDVKSDIELVLTDSQGWWPADFGNYGPLFIRMACSRNVQNYRRQGRSRTCPAEISSTEQLAR